MKICSLPWMITLCLCANAQATQFTSGNLSNTGGANPAVIELNLVYNAMNGLMSVVEEFVTNHNQCPPANIFSSSSTRNQVTITNGSKCDIIATFGSVGPGSLQNKTIRMVPKPDNTQPGSVNFGFRETVTNVDYGSNGSDSSFLLRQPAAYSWSPTLQGSSFGNTPSTSTSDTLNASYDTIGESESSANSYSSSSSSGSGSTTANIQSV